MRGLKRQDDRDEPGVAEVALMVASVGLTLVLFSYTAYHALAADDGGPQAEVVGARATPEGVEVEVRLTNGGSGGFRSVTVEVGCGEPPLQVVLDNVPAAARRTFTVLCPPGTEAPEASVVAVVPA